MEYDRWREDIFGQEPDSDPVMLDLLPQTDSVSPAENLDHVERALDDADIHNLFSRDQIGIGLQLIYSNSCGDICFFYIKNVSEQRRVEGVRKLSKLYTSYFDRYCLAPVGSIGNDHLEGDTGYLCYMFWDIFVLCPGNASAAMASAALDVMAYGIRMKNDNCVVSAIHGLGHWALDDSRAVQILRQWLRRPTTQNANVIDYAKKVTNGGIQ